MRVKAKKGVILIKSSHISGMHKNVNESKKMGVNGKMEKIRNKSRFWRIWDLK